MGVEAWADALTAAISDAKVTQRQLADAVGVTPGAVSQWVGGDRVPPPHMVFSLELCLRVPPGALSQHLGYLPVAALTTGDLPTGEPVDTVTVVRAVLEADVRLGPVDVETMIRVLRRFVDDS